MNKLLLVLLSTLFISYANGQFQAQLANELDLVFILDTSGSVSISQFAKLKQAAIDVVKGLDVSISGVHVGMITYGSSVGSVFKFPGPAIGDYTKDVTISRINSLIYTGGMTATGDALYTARTNIFSKRRDMIYPRIALLITDGYSNFGTKNIVSEANELKKEGVVVFTIGVGNGINERELDSIASTPINEFKMVIGDYDLLYSCINRIIATLFKANALLQKGVAVVRTTGLYEVNYYETPINTSFGNFVEIELTDLDGISRMAYSFDQSNPTNYVRSENNTTLKINTVGSRNQIMFVFIPPNKDRIYFSVQGTTAFNRYSLKIADYHYSSVIGK